MKLKLKTEELDALRTDMDLDALGYTVCPHCNQELRIKNGAIEPHRPNIFSTKSCKGSGQKVTATTGA